MAAAPAAVVAATPAQLQAEIAADWTRDLSAQFEDFHRNPELGFQETRTAAIMARQFRAIPGMEVTEKVGGTGVVGVLRNGPGKTVLLRADMDGLPIQERSGLAYQSTARGKDKDGNDFSTMHACGHDTHITGLIATARRLSAHRKDWSGTIVFVAQPAEEILTGAPAMVRDGLFSRFPKPDYALAWHVASNLPTGTIGFADATQFSSSDGIDIIVKGVGTHGASPQLGRDPIVIGAAIVNNLQSIRSRELGPFQPGVVTVGQFQAGTARNIIPETATLKLTVRANDEETRSFIKAAVKRVAENTARAYGVPEDQLPQVIDAGGTPATINSPALAQRLRPLLSRELGPGVVQPYVQKDMGAEDYAYFVQPGIESVYFRVGGTPQAAFAAEAAGGPKVPGHHTPLFKVDGEAAVTLGARAMTLAVLDLLGAPRSAAR